MFENKSNQLLKYRMRDNCLDSCYREKVLQC